MWIIAIWSHIDHILTIMTTNFLNSDFETVNAMLAAITSSAGKRARHQGGGTIRPYEQTGGFKVI